MNQFEKNAFDIHLAASLVEDKPSKKELFKGFIDEIPEKADDYDFSLLCDNERIKFTLTDNTTIENDAYKYGEAVCIVAARHETSGRIYAYYIDIDKNEYVADRLVTICNEDLGIYEKTELPFNINEKFPSEFYSLSIEAKNSIRDQYTENVHHPIVESANIELSMSEMKTKFRICRNTYHPDTQKVISRLFDETGSFDSDVNKTNKMKLQYIMNTNTTYHPEKVGAETISAELDRNISGMTYAKGKVIDAIKSAAYCGKHGLKLLLCGPAGVGKTYFAECVARSRNKPYHTVSCASITTAVESQGISIFSNRCAGIYRTAFREMGTSDATLILDELDKCARENREHGDPTIAVTEMLGNGYLHDLFCEDKLITEHTWFIATCNEPNDIPPHIINRFDAVVHIEPYTDEERLKIAKCHILPQLAEDYHVAAERLADFIDDKAIRYIISDFCLDYGGRDLKSNLKAIIVKTIDKLKSDEDVCSLSFAEIDNILDKESVLNDPIAVYKTNRHKFSPEDCKTIDRLVNDCLTKDDGNAKYISKEKLKIIADICRTRNLATEFNYAEFISELNRSHGDMKDVKAALARSVNYLFRTGKAKNLLLVGPPGTGKTTLVLSASKTTGLPFEKISCNGISSTEYIKGTPSQFSNSEAGCIAKKLQNTGDCAIIMLDEIDKMMANTAEGYKVISSFLDMLDLKQFQDNHLNIKLNLEKILFVATANNLSNVPPELIDRFEIVELNGYSKAKKEAIFKSHILPAVLDECACKDICFTDEAVTYMIDNYTSVSGFREIRKQTEKIIGDVIIFRPEGYIIDVTDVVKHLGKPPIERGNRPTVNIPGNVNGLSVNSVSKAGNVFSVQAIRSYSDKLTGLAQDCLKESVDIARTVVENICPDCCGKHYHIHFAEGAVPKDGPSAGLATALAILSYETGEIIASHTAYTGEIDIFGNIWAVGGVPEKVEAAITAGCTHIFIPAQNYEHDSESLSELKAENVKIIPVSHVFDVLEELNFNCTKNTK